MIEIQVAQDGHQWEFRREFLRGRIVVGGDRGIFNRLQLRSIAALLDVPVEEDVAFVDAGSFELLFELAVP